MIARRSFLTGLAAGLITAPAIVRAGSLMPVKAIKTGLISPAGVLLWGEEHWWMGINGLYHTYLQDDGRYVLKNIRPEDHLRAA